MGAKGIKKQDQILEMVGNRYQKQKGLLHLYFKPTQWSLILSGRDWSDIKHLILDHCCIDEDNIQNFTHSPWPNLQQLRLADNKISKKCLELLLQKQLNKLEAISLNNNQIGDGGFESLIKRQFESLTKIYVDRNNITHVGLQVMLDYDTSRLIWLSLSQNAIGSKGCKMLSKLDLSSLIYLQISKGQKIISDSCRIGDQGMVQLSKARFPARFHIKLKNNNIGLCGLESICLADWPNIASIEMHQLPPISVFSIIHTKIKVNLNFFKFISNQHFRYEIEKVLTSRFQS